MGIPFKRSEDTFSPCPEGLFHAVCCDVIDKGLVETQYGKKFKVMVVWQVDEENPDNDDKRYTVRQMFTNSDNEKAKLRLALESWRGKRFEQDEMDAFDIESVVGAPCQVQVVHRIGKESKVWANVQAVVPASKDRPPLGVDESYIREKDRKEDHGNGSVTHTGELTEDDIPF